MACQGWYADNGNRSTIAGATSGPSDPQAVTHELVTLGDQAFVPGAAVLVTQ